MNLLELHRPLTALYVMAVLLCITLVFSAPAQAVENSGSIEVTADNVNGMDADPGTIVNTATGSITTQGDNSHGMYANDHSTANNSGSITIQGDHSYGMYARDHSTASNSGSVNTQVGSSDGMCATGFSTVSNSGSVTTRSNNSYGICAINGSTANNSGSITIQGDRSYGIVADNNSIANNTGTITTQGERSYGMIAFTGSSATNTGTISVYGKFSSAVRARQSFYNSGTLASYGADGHAVCTYANGHIHLQTGTRILAGDVYADLGGFFDQRLYLDGSGTMDFDIIGDWNQLRKTQAGTWTVARNITPQAGNLFVFLDGGSLGVASGISINARAYTQAAGTTLQVALDGAGTIPLSIIDDASLDGNLVVDLPCRALDGNFVVVNAGNIVGAFDSITSLNPNFSFAATTSATQVSVTGVSYTPQWDNTALGLSSSMSSSLAFLHVPGTRSRQLLSENQEQEQREIMLASNGPLIDLFSTPVGKDRYGVYVQPMFSVSERDAFGSAPGYSANMVGVEIGADTFVGDNLLLGAFLGYAGVDVDFNGMAFAENDSENQQLYIAGVYGGYRMGNWLLTDTLSFTHGIHESERNAGLGQMAIGDYDSQLIDNQLLASYIWEVDDVWKLAPELGLSAKYLNRGGFSETEAVNAVRYDDFDDFFLESVAGLRLSGGFKSGAVTLTPYARLSWLHDLNDNDITVRQTLGATTAQVTQENDDDHFGLDCGVSIQKGVGTLALSYSGEVSRHSESHGLTASLRFGF